MSSNPPNQVQLSNKKTFGDLFQETHIFVYKYVFGLSGGPAQDVDDIVSETYSRAWAARNRFQGDKDDALKWFFTIAKNLLVDKYRRQQSGEKNRHYFVVEVPAMEEDPEDQLILLEQRKRIWHLLQTLTSDSKEVIVLRYILGWQVRKIAAHMNKNETAISMTIHRSLNRIKENWQDHEAESKDRS